ncbi:MAG: BON domain-containing protein [Burkholderiaceae bacterium]|nr:BON domain-containing protein [Burkholderiaceae bacterium]
MNKSCKWVAVNAVLAQAISTRAISAVLLGSVALAGCAPLVIGAVAAGTAVVATDRRSTGTQLDDKSIQVRVANELTAALKGNDIHISVNSFERRVLLTGEVANEALKSEAGAIAARSKDVRMVSNELVIAPPSTFSERTEDNALGARVRAAFVNTKEISFNSVDIVTERRTIYLMGRVTPKEGDVAAHVASRVSGVKQVVKLFDVAGANEANSSKSASEAVAKPQPAEPPAATSPAATVTPIPPR